MKKKGKDRHYMGLASWIGYKVEQVVRRWIAVYPPPTLDQDDEKLV